MPPKPDYEQLEARVAALEIVVADHETRILALEAEEPEPPDPPIDGTDPEEPPPGGGTGTPNPDNWLRVTNVSGQVVLDYPLQFGRCFLPGEVVQFPRVLMDGAGLPTQANVKNRWPDGSVKFAVIAVVIPELRPGVPVTMTFRDQARRRHLPVAWWALAETFPDFDASIRLTHPTTGAVIEASARQMLEAGAYTEWTAGSVAQTLVCCDRSPGRVYDIGWSEHRSFHPWFVCTFWPGLGRVRVRYVGEISNSEALEAQQYDLLELMLAGLPVYGQAGIAQRYATRWTRTAWYGGEPEPAVNIDHNVSYVAATKLIANYDPAVAPSDAYAATQYEGWLGTNRAIGGAGWWQKAMPTTGGRRDIGLAPMWCVMALLSGDWRWREIALGQAELAGAWNRQIREGDPTKPGFGRTITCYSRPSLWYLDNRYTPTAADKLNIVGSDTADGWTADDAHQPDPFSVPYLLTGDSYYLDALELWNGANSLTSSPANARTGRNLGHCVSWGMGQVRGQAWLYRTMFHAAALMPDDDPLKADFTRMVEEAVAYDEGCRAVVGTEYEGTEIWTRGRSYLGTVNDGWRGMGPPPFGQGWWAGVGPYAANDPAYYNADVTATANAHWMNNYVILALGRGRELGYPVGALLEWVGPHVVGQMGTPSYPAQLTSQYVIPDTTKTETGSDWFECWEDVLLGWSAQKQTGLLNGQTEMLYWPASVTYFTYARAALALCTHLPGGEAAWAACEDLIALKTAESGKPIDWPSDPTWAVVARE